MTKTTRILVLVASVLLALTFFFPLWQIDIWAPQYPEGLLMQIWASKITGDVRNMNILNHYIGMKQIDANSIPELRFFPLIFGFFTLTGIATAFLKSRRIFQIWTLLLLIFATAAFIDFYRWEYDYGHNLSPDAAMKLEESYQPPLIGKKVLLNIEAWSLPGLGGYAMTIALVLSWIGFILEFKAAGLKSVRKNARALATATIAGIMLFAASACTSGKPEPIDYGKDSCASCKMMITDKRFGAELVTRKGKVYKFDSVECMDHFQKANQLTDAKIFVPDASESGTLIHAESAAFAIDPEIRSPMGKGIFASVSAENLKKLPGVTVKDTLQWNQLQQALAHGDH